MRFRSIIVCKVEFGYRSDGFFELRTEGGEFVCSPVTWWQ